MEILQQTPDEKVTGYFLFYKLRTEGYPEDEIASKFKAPSALALYRQLHDQGFPVCEACGAYCTRSTLCENCTAKRKPKRGGDEGIELPPPSSAIDLFAPVVDSLDLVELTTLSQVYRNERFEAAEVHDMAVFIDSSEDVKTFGKSVQPLGATQFPTLLLTKLIALYVIAGEPVERLLAALHPRYSALSREEKDKINGRAEKLVLLAGQVAKEVTADFVRRGHHTEELSPLLQAAANYRNRELRAGVPETEIEQTLISRGLRPEEMDRVKNLSSTIFPD
jgi:hypothetical protein